MCCPAETQIVYTPEQVDEMREMAAVFANLEGFVDHGDQTSNTVSLKEAQTIGTRLLAILEKDEEQLP